MHERALGSLELVSLEGLGPRAFATGPHEPYGGFLGAVLPADEAKLEGKTLIIACILQVLPSFLMSK